VDSSSYSSEDVLNDLDPLSRALLDLSIQREMNDAEIAQVLGTDEESVFEVRVGLLRNLAEKVAPEHAEDELPELHAAVAERLYSETETETDEAAVDAHDLGDEGELQETPVEEEPEPHPAPVAVESPPQRTSRRRSWLPIVLPILVVLAVIAVIVAAGSGNGGDEQKSKPAAQAPPTEQPNTNTGPTPKSKPKPKTIRLTSFGSATGTASIDGDRLTMTLKNLPPADGGTYTVWLYNSIIDAKKIGTVTNGKVEVKLPAGADKYRYVDVSLEPPDGNPNHSGQSVLRVPLEKLSPSG
jgi:hypothetical protein